ncbi:MAG: hypothetical protein ABI896_11715 [Actinomycetota bacterium]
MSPRSAALWTGGAAWGWSLFHVFHQWIGKEDVSGIGVAAVVAAGLLYAWWALCLQEAGRGEASALSGLLVLAAGWSLAAHGVGALIACRPDCDRYELLLGLVNTVLGAAAAGASAWAIRREPSSVRPRAGLISAGLIVAALTLEALR